MFNESRFVFRTVNDSEADEVSNIEKVCFPPNEACSEKNMKERVKYASSIFLVAYDNEKKQIAGFINGIATNETKFLDKFFTDVTTHIENGKNIMICGVDVMPDYRMQGLATIMMKKYVEMARNAGRKNLYLTCLERLVKMYEKMGYVDLGDADSTWGGEKWHEMILKI